MDEPFSGLDPVNSSILRAAFFEMRARGKTLVFSTHQMETVEALCEAIVIVDRGRVVVGGPIRDVKRASGRQVVRIALDGDGRAERHDLVGWLDGFPGVRLTRPGADYVELTVPREIDPQAILRAVLERGERVARFEIADPSLEEIFIERVGIRPGDDEDLAPHSDDGLGRAGGHAVSAPERSSRTGPGLRRNAWLIARREYVDRVRTRTFVAATAVLAVVAVGLALAPIGLRYLDRGTVARIGVVAETEPALAGTVIQILDEQLNRVPQGADPAAWERPYRFETVADAAAGRAAVDARRPGRPRDDPATLRRRARVPVPHLGLAGRPDGGRAPVRDVRGGRPRVVRARAEGRPRPVRDADLRGRPDEDGVERGHHPRPADRRQPVGPGHGPHRPHLRDPDRLRDVGGDERRRREEHAGDGAPDQRGDAARAPRREGGRGRRCGPDPVRRDRRPGGARRPVPGPDRQRRPRAGAARRGGAARGADPADPRSVPAVLPARLRPVRAAVRRGRLARQPPGGRPAAGPAAEPGVDGQLHRGGRRDRRRSARP